MSFAVAAEETFLVGQRVRAISPRQSHTSSDHQKRKWWASLFPRSIQDIGSWMSENEAKKVGKEK